MKASIFSGTLCAFIMMLIVCHEAPGYELSDSHFHLTNCIQEGTDFHEFVNIMGTTVERSTLFGIPLQQQWSFGNTGDFAPTYYFANRPTALLLLLY